MSFLSSLFLISRVYSAYTLQLDDDTHAIRITDSKVRARDVFLGKDELPKPGGPNPLREMYNKNYGLELFYLPTSSLKITNILRWGSSRCHVRAAIVYVG